MITVAEADAIIRSQIKDFGTEIILLEESLGRVLAENIKADRDLPSCNRVTMDGIAIKYAALENQVGRFKKFGIQAAGDNPVEIDNLDQCIEIMTGAALPDSTDTVIRYEDLVINGDQVTVVSGNYKKGQNVHAKGIDKKAGELVIKTGTLITPAEISMLASVGEQEVRVKRLPRVVVISTGDELVSVDSNPMPWQVRSSNGHTLKAILQQIRISAHALHLPDNAAAMETALKECLKQFEVILLSGGVSMGKYDFLPEVLNKLQVNKLFHKVQQRPGKPFWFGKHDEGSIIFAFPGNPVSTFMCAHRYLLPWLHHSLYGARQSNLYAILDANFNFNLSLQYFLQVKLKIDQQGRLLAEPVEGHGSGDFANLTDANAFMELPLEECNFKKGMIFPIWPFKRII